MGLFEQSHMYKELILTLEEELGDLESKLVVSLAESESTRVIVTLRYGPHFSRNPHKDWTSRLLPVFSYKFGRPQTQFSRTF